MNSEEYGTAIYTRGYQLPGVLNLIEELPPEVVQELIDNEPDAMDAVYEHVGPLAKALKSLGMRLNRRACGDMNDQITDNG